MNNEFSSEQIIEQITDALQESDPDFIVKIANRVLAQKVKHIKDDIFVVTKEKNKLSFNISLLKQMRITAVDLASYASVAERLGKPRNYSIQHLCDEIFRLNAIIREEFN